MIAYIIQVSICWMFFYALYHFLLRNETFHTHNRFYLLGTLVVSLFIPFFGSYEPVAEVSQIVPVEYVMDFQYQTLDIPTISAEAPSKSFWSWSLLWYAYYIGIALFGFRLVFGCYQIFKYYRSGRKQQEGGITIVYNKKKHLPFSFFSNIFLSESYKIKGDVDQIVKHEIVHAHELHSLDVLAVELIQIFFWWNPILVLYKRAIKETHEYIADNTVIAHYDVNIYSAMLLSHVNSRSRHALSNQFFQKQIKNRIKMMNKKKSSGILRLKYLIAVPMLIVLTIFTAVGRPNTVLESIMDLQPLEIKPLEVKTTTLDLEQQKITIEKPEQVSIKEAVKESSPKYFTRDTFPANNGIYERAEIMPRFPGCEDEPGDNRAKDSCAKKKMMKYIYENLKYPEDAKKNGLQGNVVLRFVVTEEGAIDELRVLRNPGGGSLGEAAAKVVASMNNMPEKWIPGKQRGRPVAVRYTLPVRFKLESSPVIKKPDFTGSVNIQFLGGSDEEESVIPAKIKNCVDNQCSMDVIMKQLYKFTRYPAAAKVSKANGIVVFSFTLDEKGQVTNIKLPKNYPPKGYGLEEAALKGMQALSELEWSPELKNGKPIKKGFVVLFDFK